jgi:hypothetical protein
MMSICAKCGISRDKVPLYRNGPTGVVGVDWCCINCVDEIYRPKQDLVDLCNIISDNKPTADQGEGQRSIMQHAKPETRQYTEVWDY